MKTLWKLVKAPRKRQSKLLYKPDKVFRRKIRFKIAVRVIKRPIGNPWEASIFSSQLVFLRANWLIVPIICGEINEHSDNALANELRQLELEAFNIYRDSCTIIPSIDQKPLVLAKKVASVLSHWKTNELYRLSREIHFEIQLIEQFRTSRGQKI